MFRTLSYVLNHPLNRKHKFSALKRYFRWQTSSRIARQKIAVPFLGRTRLLARYGMTGATGNIYCGLHEFEEMGFVLHALAPGELFIDVGANIGSYSVLAAGVAQCYVVAVEPSPATFEDLLDNIHLNRLQRSVQAVNVALGEKPGSLRFTTGLDTLNHVLSDDESVPYTTVEVCPLDELLARVVPDLAVPSLGGPTVIKVDVEGFETEVVRGAARTLQSPSLLAVLLEINHRIHRYGYDPQKLNENMLSFGFVTASYDPISRSLQVPPSYQPATILYVRDVEELRRRLSAAPRHTLNNVEF